MPDLLLISDLHLGSHLKPRMRGEFVHLASRIEQSFPRFIDHYLREGEWQLIVNGDFIDFWNVDLPDHVGESGERLAVRRLHAVFDAHPRVEDALARFVRAGHGVVFVTGNHDAELLYAGVRQALVDRLEGAMAEDDLDPGTTRTGLVRLDSMPPGRIRFVRWFLREEGGAWIEHGHKFDPSCATPAAMSPTRGGTLVQTVAEVATRNFSNWMPEMDYDAPDKFTAQDYVRWALARGWRFLIRVILLYLRTLGRVLALWAATGRVDEHGQRAHEERLARVAANAGLQMSALTALEQMAPPPSVMTVGGMLSVTALDHLLAVLTPTPIALWLSVVLGVSAWWGLLVGIGASALSLYWIRRGRRPRDVARDMLEVAARVGSVTRVPLVLMGHSHHGQLERQGDVVYANSGSWLDGSHLVVRRDRTTGRLTEVELRQWRNDGITRVDVMAVPHESAGEGAPTADAEAATGSAMAAPSG
ncbi:metallophosphoesterase [Paraliomyxa miuraensis]|uniref:metallophosphoesterase n=1 Tax=Paraliomyxa miuraensis TaxID=376150 RepID=UPI0022518686|nr:metallophosphoesterase [Paraliomyxa miuraensis]MCX4245593.1 metallophosphoesterase [Paraliomyxa miuraensis]